MNVLTSILLIFAALLTLAWLVAAQRRLVACAARRFVALPRLRQVAIVLAVGVMTVCAQKSGTNDVVNAEIMENWRRGEESLIGRDVLGTPPAQASSASFDFNNLHVENSQVETNVFAITSFSFDCESRSLSFEASWTSNFFDLVDSRNVDLFSSTNLLERRWTPLGALAVPSDTNACAFVVTSNDVSAAVRPQFLDTFAGLGFFRFGLDLDSDGDGLTDAYESFCSLTDPTLADTDGDGLGDGRELQVGTDPFVSDSDDDGVCDGDEVAAGANPCLDDSDSDGLSDAVEIGTMAALPEEDFMWFDMSGDMHLITSQAVGSKNWTVPLPDGHVINNVCYTNAKIQVDGTVHLLCPTNPSSWANACTSGTLGNTRYSACHVTLALCGADLYAKTNDWGSQILHGVVQSDGKKYAVVEYRNIGLNATRNTNETLTCQLILPHGETNAVYVSYLCASNAFHEVNLIAGVQCGGIKSLKTGQRYYNLTWPQSDGFPQDRLTIKYMIGTGSDPASADTDADGLSDSVEVLTCRSNPLVADTDGDGLDDGREVAIGTNPLVRDSDGDGMSDGWEVQQNLDPLTDDSASDPDGDGLPNLCEYELGTSPTSSDSDGDGLSDVVEVEMQTDPLCKDTDGDGLDDGTESEIGTSARDADTDLDGLTDAWEHANGLDPLSAAGDAGSDGDPDGDFLSNAKEMEYATDPLTADTDSDALVDGQETGSVFATNAIPWLAFDAGEDLTSVIATNSRRCASRPLPTPLRIQGEVVTNLTISANGLVFLNKAGYANLGDSRSASNFKAAINKNALVLAPYLQYAYIRSDVADSQTAIKYGTATHDGTGYLLVEWLNSYYNTSTWQTNSISFQLAIPTNAPDRAYARYRDVMGRYMDGQDASIGMQTFDGSWLHSWCYHSAGRVCDGIAIEFLFGTNSDPLAADTDGDGIADGQEAAIGTSLTKSDTDDDGLPDGWEIKQGLDPQNADGNDGADADPDGDGLSNLDEYRNGSRPGNADTDGDGVSDGAEVAQGTSPSDQTDSIPVHWVVVTGNLEKEVPKTAEETVSIPANTMMFVGVFVHSEEYPQWTSQQSEYNDAVYWHVRASGQTELEQTLRVNNEDSSWDRATGQSVNGFSPVVYKTGAIYQAGAGGLDVSVTLRAMNVRDGALPTTVLVGFFPLRVVQSNCPTATGVAGTTDAATAYGRTLVLTNGIAYITAQPAAPQLTAQFKDLPQWLDVTWGGALTTERGDKRFDGIDDRALTEQTLAGDAPYNLTAALNGEIVGGRCELRLSAGGASSVYPFSIRGKNPLDATARSYVTSAVADAFKSYAWMIMKHESKAGSRVYNQFNASENAYKELPSWGTPHGWGIAQIDKGRNGDTTAEVYDWHANVAAMNVKLTEARNTALRFIGYYSSAYSGLANWTTPPATNINGQVISAEQWSVMVLYNGAAGIPSQTTPSHGTGFRSPLQFDPQTGKWIFHANTLNSEYVRDVLTDGSQREEE